MFVIFDTFIEGKFLLESEESTSNALTGERIFEHIRKKAKNFPTINKSTHLNSVPHILKNELFSSRQDLVNMSGLDNLDLKDPNQVRFDSRKISAKAKTQDSPSLMTKQCYAVSTETRRVDSHFGFKSIFSFL